MAPGTLSWGPLPMPPHRELAARSLPMGLAPAQGLWVPSAFPCSWLPARPSESPNPPSALTPRALAPAPALAAAKPTSPTGGHPKRHRPARRLRHLLHSGTGSEGSSLGALMPPAPAPLPSPELPGVFTCFPDPCHPTCALSQPTPASSPPGGLRVKSMVSSTPTPRNEHTNTWRVFLSESPMLGTSSLANGQIQDWKEHMSQKIQKHSQ